MRVAVVGATGAVGREILKVLEARGELSAGRRRLARVPEGADLMWGEGVPWPVARIRNVWMFPGVPPFVRALFFALQGQLPVSPARTSLADVRRGEFEGLREAITLQRDGKSAPRAVAEVLDTTWAKAQKAWKAHLKTLDLSAGKGLAGRATGKRIRSIPLKNHGITFA